MKEVTKEEFEAFLASYPRPLTRNVTTICEPPYVNYNDFERAPYWPDSVVAGYSAYTNYDGTGGPTGFRILEDIDSPVPDDGKRDTGQPLFDSNGIELHEGDVVKAAWGWSSVSGQDIRTETILIRDKGTKYEHWSFESCHNLVRGFEMVKVEPSPCK